MVMRKILERPDYLMREDTPEAAAEDSYTMYLTRPAMYQWTLHNILVKARCAKKDNSYCDALWGPERHCKDMEEFRSYFPAGLRALPRVNLDNAISHKVFHPAGSWEQETTKQFDHDDYDDPANQLLKDAVPGFCGADAFDERERARRRNWARNVKKNQ